MKSEKNHATQEGVDAGSGEKIACAAGGKKKWSLPGHCGAHSLSRSCIGCLRETVVARVN